MEWVEVNLTIDDLPTAEVYADVLRGFVSGGVVIQAANVKNLPDGTGQEVGPYKISGFFLFEDNFETLKQEISRALLRLPASISPHFRPLEKTNWVDSWKKHYRPTPIGEKLIILPSWEKNPDPARCPIRIEPGMAFGTGTHETTQIALLMMERAIREKKIKGGETRDLIDIGCGSGILTIAASRLGVDALVGVDVDHEAVDSARENARLNDVPSIEWGLGSVPEVIAGQFGLQKASVVVANIIAPILMKLLDEGMAQTLKKDGVLILSGILLEQAPDLLAALEKHQLFIIDREEMGDWVGFACSQIPEAT